MMKKITFYLVVSFLFVSALSFAQGTITGTITDSGLGGALNGANVIEDGTDNGAISDFDGNFSLTVEGTSGTVSVSYLGYVTKSVSYTLTNGTADIGSIAMEEDANALAEVVVIGTGVIDLASGRNTPVAVSTISARDIQEKVVGNVEITEALKGTPSAYVSGQSGFGDSQLFLRGFDQRNIGVLLNGQPVNGMEDGRVYWSNWSGIADIANGIEVQRGLGASKLAISSVGGTTNIIMKAADKKEGGYARVLGGNDDYIKGTVAYNTGLSEKGWAFSVLLDYWSAHRKWSKGTYGQGSNYFFAVGYKPSDKHSFNFLLTGAPQLHGQKWSQSRETIDLDPKYNQHWGYSKVDGNEYSDIESERQNYYHKPVMNLNWDFNISDKTELSTVAYASWGRGGGTGPRGNGRIRTGDYENGLGGQIDYIATEAQNTAIGVGGDYGNDLGAGYIRRASVNNHSWYGIISNFNHDINENLSVNVGVDGRMYTGDHFRQVADFYGLTGWSNDRPDDAVVTNSYDADPWASVFDFADEGDRINYDFSEDINYIGGFGQIEYTVAKFSTFLQGSYSSQTYQREDRFQEDENGNQITASSEKVTKDGYNIKGGLGYSLGDGSVGDHKIFINAGYYSRQPFLDNVFRPDDNIGVISPEVENEIIRSVEGGYHVVAGDLRLNFNAYVTDWANRTDANTGTQIDPDSGDEIDVTILQRGIRQYHTGGELDLNWRASTWLNLNAYVSAGSYVYKGESDFETYNADTQELISSESGVNRDGVKVSSAPQFTTGLGARAKLMKGLSIDGSINYRANHYEFTDESVSAGEYQSSKLKPYSITDLGLTYVFDLGSNPLTLRGNVYNVFDYIGLSNTDRFGYFAENGTTFNASLRYNF